MIKSDPFHAAPKPSSARVSPQLGHSSWRTGIFHSVDQRPRSRSFGEGHRTKDRASHGVKKGLFKRFLSSTDNLGTLVSPQAHYVLGAESKSWAKETSFSDTKLSSKVEESDSVFDKDKPLKKRRNRPLPCVSKTEGASTGEASGNVEMTEFKRLRQPLADDSNSDTSEGNNDGDVSLPTTSAMSAIMTGDLPQASEDGPQSTGVRKSTRTNRGQRYKQLLSQGVLQASRRKQESG